jgi:hypothetical protein
VSPPPLLEYAAEALSTQPRLSVIHFILLYTSILILFMRISFKLLPNQNRIFQSVLHILPIVRESVKHPNRGRTPLVSPLNVSLLRLHILIGLLSNLWASFR